MGFHRTLLARIHYWLKEIHRYPLVKKLMFLALKKMAIHSANWHFLVLTFQCAECVPAALHGPAAPFQWHSAEKNGAALRSAEKYGNTRHKVAFFSATAVARTFFH